MGVIDNTFYRNLEITQSPMTNNTPKTAFLFTKRPNFVKINPKDVSTCAEDEDTEVDAVTDQSEDQYRSKGSILIAYASRKFAHFDAINSPLRSKNKKLSSAHVKWTSEENQP